MKTRARPAFYYNTNLPIVMGSVVSVKFIFRSISSLNNCKKEKKAENEAWWPNIHIVAFPKRISWTIDHGFIKF